MPQDEFTLYDLRVEVVDTGKPMVCGHRAGDYFLGEGEDLGFPSRLVEWGNLAFDFGTGPHLPY